MNLIDSLFRLSKMASESELMMQNLIEMCTRSPVSGKSSSHPPALTSSVQEKIDDQNFSSPKMQKSNQNFVFSTSFRPKNSFLFTRKSNKTF